MPGSKIGTHHKIIPTVGEMTPRTRGLSRRITTITAGIATRAGTRSRKATRTGTAGQSFPDF